MDAGRGCLQATGDVRGRRNFVVKALPAATTRGGSAWQTSKGVFPTGARAPKKSAGSVDGAVARPFTGKRGTRHEPSYRSWTRPIPSPTLHVPRDANHLGRRDGHLCQPMTRSPRFDSPEAGDEPGCEWRVSRRPRSRLEMGPSGPFPRSKATSTKGGPGDGCPPSCFLSSFSVRGGGARPGGSTRGRGRVESPRGT